MKSYAEIIRFREPGWRQVALPLLVTGGLAAGLSMLLMDSAWAARAPRQVAVVAMLLGVGACALAFLWLRFASPLTLPKVLGVWGPVAELADRLGFTLAGIDLRRQQRLMNDAAKDHLWRIEEEYEGPFERDRKTPLPSPQPGEPAFKSDLLRRALMDGGVHVAHRAWRRPPLGWVHTHTAVAPYSAQVAMVMGYDTSEGEQYRERLGRLQRQLALAEMVSGFLHDAKNLSFASRNAVRALKTETDPAERDKLTRMIEAILDSAEAILERAGEYTNRRAGPRVCTDVCAALRSLSALLEILLPRGITLRLALSDAAQRVELDPVELDHTITNLVVNARDALGGQGEIVLECGPAADEGGVRLAVRDNGPGVPEALRAHIFDPFVTTKSDAEGEGNGLGLAMAKAFAESAGGTLMLEDTGKGACFTFTFPTCTPCEGLA